MLSFLFIINRKRQRVKNKGFPIDSYKIIEMVISADQFFFLRKDPNKRRLIISKNDRDSPALHTSASHFFKLVVIFILWASPGSVADVKFKTTISMRVRKNILRFIYLINRKSIVINSMVITLFRISLF